MYICTPKRSNGLMGEWLSQRSAKPSTAVRIRFRPRKCRADDLKKSSVFVCRSVWVQAPTLHQTTPAYRLLLCESFLRTAYLLMYGCENRLSLLLGILPALICILARTSRWLDLRIGFRPRNCRADDLKKSSVFVCRSGWVQAPTLHQAYLLQQSVER